MLYIKDNIIKDSNLITIETEDSIIYNPDHDTLLSDGWEVYKEEQNTKIIKNKGFVKTTSEEFELLDKSVYENAIVFIEDTKLIWSNDVYYGVEDAYYNTLFVSMEETIVEAEPNKYYCWSEPVSTLTISLKEPTNTNILNIYTFEFTTSDSGCTLALPQTIKWMSGEAPEIEPAMTYQISIANNLAIIQGFTYAQ